MADFGFKKRVSLQNLADAEVLIIDNHFTSDYFKVTNFPTELTAGKNMFKLSGNSNLLDSGFPILFEILPEGNPLKPIYVEVADYIDFAQRRIISPWVYHDDPAGLATLTVLGVANRRPNGKSVPSSWRNRYNVRWQRDLIIEPLKHNITPIVFNIQPRITINENVKSFLSESYFTHVPQVMVTQSNDGAYIDFSPVTTGWFSDVGTLFASPTNSSLIFSSSMEGGTLTIPNPTASISDVNGNLVGLTYTPNNFPATMPDGSPNSLDYTASIIEVVNDNTLKLSNPYVFSYYHTVGGTGVRNTGGGNGGTLPTNQLHIEQPFVMGPLSNFTVSFTEDPIEYTTSSLNLTSYANIIVANLSPIAGDVYRVKTWMKSNGTAVWDVLSDEVVEGVELLVDKDNVYNMKRTGKFINQDLVNDYWESSSYATVAGVPPILKADSEIWMNGMIISGSEHFTGSQAETGSADEYIVAKCKKKIDVFKGCTYLLSFKAKAYEVLDDVTSDGTPKLGRTYMNVYVSGSAVDYGVPVNEPFGKKLDTQNLMGPVPSSGNALNQTFTTPMVNFRASSWVGTPTATTVVNQLPDVQSGTQPQVIADVMSYEFSPERDGQVTPVFKVNHGKWFISEVSIRGISENGFTPNHIILEARVPQYQEDDVLDFKFEFFDYNGVRADLVLVTESISFAGGNTYINGQGYLGDGFVFDGTVSA